MKHRTPESNFEQEIQILARKYKSMYIKIPDTQMITEKNRKSHGEQKRPFDGVLVTPKGNFCIECKMDNGKLSPHQADYQKLINMANGSFFVFRKKRLKNRVDYSIETGDMIYENFNTCSSMLGWFMENVR